MNLQTNYLTSCGCTCSVRICSPSSAGCTSFRYGNAGKRGVLVVLTELEQQERMKQLQAGALIKPLSAWNLNMRQIGISRIGPS